MSNEKQIAEQLSQLKISPRAEWKASNRQLLVSQIYGSYDSVPAKTAPSAALSFKDLFYAFNFNRITQPVLVMAMAAFVAVFGGAMGIMASKGSHPGQPLYAVKRATEKTQLLLTTDQKQKAELSLQFAVNRAQEMDEVLKGGEERSDESDDKIVALKDDLRDEIDQAKGHLEKMGAVAMRKPAAKPTIKPKPATSSPDQEDSDEEVFAVDSGKDEDGLDVYIPSAPADPRSIIEEAKRLVNENDLSGALDKLNQMEEAVDEEEDDNRPAATSTVEQGEQATSTLR